MSSEVSKSFLNAFITNLGKYNEGELIGEWVSFPTTCNEIKAVFKRIGIGQADEFGQIYEEWFITDFDCSIGTISAYLCEYENLDILNYLTSTISELNAQDLEKYTAVLNSACDSFSGIADLINLSFNLDCYDYLPGISDKYDLGYYYAICAGMYSENIPRDLINYFDFEEFGRDIMINENGAFHDSGYIRRNENNWVKIFDGAIENIPIKYRLIC